MSSITTPTARVSTKVDWSTLRKSLVPENADTVIPPSVKLPVLPKALLEFGQAARDPDASVQELSRIISTDSGLSGDLLRRANSAQNCSKNPITSVHHALVKLGVKATHLRLTASGMKEAMKSSSSQLVNFQNFWNTNLERAIFAREVAKHFNTDEELAFTTGMLQDFLLPLITNQLIDDYLDFMGDPKSFGSLTNFEQERFGWNHAVAAASVMAAWQFPDELVCCVALHHQGAKLLNDPQYNKSSLAAVAMSTLLPDALRQEPQPMDRLFQHEEELDGFELLAVAETVDEEFNLIADCRQNQFSFLRTVKRELDRRGNSDE